MLRVVAPIAALALLLGACSSTPAGKAPAAKVSEVAPNTTAVEDGMVILNIQAAAGLNPGGSGQPAPVRVRIFELKNTAAFNRADYFALAERAGDALGPDLIDQDEVLIRPGETRRVERKLNPATRQIGLVVGYREIDRALWRTVLSANAREYRIELDPQAVRSTPVTLPAQ